MSVNLINQIVVAKTEKEISIDSLLQLCNKFRESGYKVASLSKKDAHDDLEDTTEIELGLYNSSNTYTVVVGLIKSVTKVKDRYDYNKKIVTEYVLYLNSADTVPLSTLQRFQDTALDFIPV